jgi:hypothetical protein
MQTNTRAFLLWFGPALVVGIAVARVSVWVQPHFSPVILYPLLIGAALGAILCGLAQLAQLRNAGSAVAGALFVVLVAAAAEHAFFYLDFVARESLERSRKMLEAGVPDEGLSSVGFVDYMLWQGSLDRKQVLLWIGNAALMAVAAGGMVGWYVRRQIPDPNPLPEGEGAR